MNNPNEYDIEYTDSQFDAITSTSPECIFVGGIGSGKSFALGQFVLNEACLVGSLGILTAPTSGTLNLSTLPACKKIWSKLGLVQDIDYIIGKRPPKNWGIKPYSEYNGNVLTWAWGSYTIVDGSDNYDAHRGTELDYVAGDEFRDFKDGAYEMFQGRMRGEAKKAIGGDYRMLFVTTPPDNPNKVQDLISERVQVIYGNSFENQHNLPPGYLVGLKHSYDEITYRREVLGELIYSGGSAAYHAFSDQNIVSMPFMPNAPTVMAWDFNASAKKPMSTGLIQQIGSKWYLTKEFINKNSNTDEQCQVVLEFFKNVGFNGTLVVTGDYSGFRKDSNATRSDYAIIELYFKHYPSFRNQTRPTLSIRDRVSSLNAQFCNMAGERNFYVDSSCKKTIEDLQKTRYKENGTTLDDTDPERTHPSDMVSYWAYNWYPSDRKPIVYG